MHAISELVAGHAVVVARGARAAATRPRRACTCEIAWARRARCPSMGVMLATLAAATLLVPAHSDTAYSKVDWSATPIVTHTTPTCQVVVEPPMWPGSKIRETQLHWLSELGEQASPVFWQSWFVYPHSGVAQLQPGVWDFSQITPLVQDMLNATQGRQLCLQFGTVPQWMMAGAPGERRWDYGTEKWNETLTWDYNNGAHDFRNLTQVAEYFANFMAYYTAGGFTDSRTGQHYDGFQYDIPLFEFGNEMEYGQNPQTFTQQSDAVNAAVAAVAPKTKFLGLGLALQNNYVPDKKYFTYFLNASNHVANAPKATAIDYHYYATSIQRTDVSSYPAMFGDGDSFVLEVEKIEAIRKELSPDTKTWLKELGVIAPGDNTLDSPPLPDKYWSAKAAYWAYLYAHLAQLKIDVASMSQLVGGRPTTCSFANKTSCTNHGSGCVCKGPNYSSVTMLRWDTGAPTAAYWVLKLLVEEFGNREKQMFPTATTTLKSAQCAGPTKESTVFSNVTCGDSTIASKDFFFTYGTPSGSCAHANLEAGKCNAMSNLTDFVSRACVGQHTCAVRCDCLGPGPTHCTSKRCTVTTEQQRVLSPEFADPCVLIPKFVALEVTCDAPQPKTAVPSPDVFTQAIHVDGLRKLLVVNKQATSQTLHVDDPAMSASTPMRYIAADEPWSPIRNGTWGTGVLPPYFTGVVHLQGVSGGL